VYIYIGKTYVVTLGNCDVVVRYSIHKKIIDII